MPPGSFQDRFFRLVIGRQACLEGSLLAQRPLRIFDPLRKSVLDS